MKFKLTKWGNSFGIRIPKLFATQIGIDAGQEINVHLEGNAIIIQPKQTLDELLRDVKPENLHGEFDTGPAVGNEIW